MEAHIEDQGSVALITLLNEELDRNNVWRLGADMAPVFKQHTRVVIDMSQLRYIDSVGLSVILSYLKRLNIKGGDLKLCGVSRPVRALLEQVRMHQIFDIYKDSDDALRAPIWEYPGKMLNIVLNPQDRVRRLSHAWAF
jgi:anti-sigma B factor antagonist